MAQDSDPPVVAAKIPVTVLTGFLGSGKTTLLRAVLASPDMADTAVIINEAGEMGLDHLLLEAVPEQVLEMPGGCLCCVRRLDIVTTVRSLIERRDRGAIRGFSRIVIETSGLADPAPILYTLAVDPMLGHMLAFTAVVTLVDATAGLGTLQRHPEAVSQVAVADRILVTKTDLSPLTDDLAGLLDSLNDWAERLERPVPGTFPALLFAKPAAVAGRRRLIAQAVTPDAAHTAAIHTISVVLAQPPTRFAFARALGRLAAERGVDLLRVKGLLEFTDRPDRVAVIHAVQHTIYRPEWLERWPDADARSRLVFVTRGITAADIFERFAECSPLPWTASSIATAV